jgi:heptose I phosphotransferase
MILNVPKQFRKSSSANDCFNDIIALQGDIYRNQEGRKTLRFTADGKKYFAKIHLGVGWKEIVKNIFQGRWPILGAKNEWKAIQRLSQLQINTTPLVGYGQRGLNPARLQSFVITEDITDTISLETLANQTIKNKLSFSFKRSLIKEIARIARTLHDNGMNHRDFYICHFLMKVFQKPETSGKIHASSEKEPVLYLIDLHRMLEHRSLPARWRIKDLAGLYFSSMDCELTRRDRLRFIQHYTQQSLRTALKDHCKRWERVEWRSQQLYLKHFPIDLVHQQSFLKRVYCVADRYTDAMKLLLENPDQAFSKDAHYLKKGDSTSVVSMYLDGRHYVIKRYNILNPFHALRRQFKQSRAKCSWDSAYQLMAFGIPTTRPIAMIEKRFGFLLGKAYYMTEFVEGVCAQEYFASHKDELTARMIVKFIRFLRDVKISHGDMKATNIIINNGKPYFVDLDATKKHVNAKAFKRAFSQDIKRFMKNWHEDSVLFQLFSRCLRQATID